MRRKSLASLYSESIPNPSSFAWSSPVKKMAVRYHGCTCHLRHGQQNQQQTSDDGRYTLNNGYSSGRGGAETFSAGSKSLDDDEDSDEQKSGESTQPWYFHLIASCILVIHGLTFLVPGDGDQDDTDMVRTLASWMGYDMDWVKHFTPYAQVKHVNFKVLTSQPLLMCASLVTVSE